MGNTICSNVTHMEQYRKRLAAFIREKRGDMTLREFALRTGLSLATLHRIENMQQNVTIDMLEYLCELFDCRLQDLFPPVEHRQSR